MEDKSGTLGIIYRIVTVLFNNDSLLVLPLNYTHNFLQTTGGLSYTIKDDQHIY